MLPAAVPLLGRFPLLFPSTFSAHAGICHRRYMRGVTVNMAIVTD